MCSCIGSFRIKEFLGINEPFFPKRLTEEEIKIEALKCSIPSNLNMNYIKSKTSFSMSVVFYASEVECLNKLKNESEEEKSFKGRGKRALIVAYVTASIAAITFGGISGLLVGAAALEIFLVVSAILLPDELGMKLSLRFTVALPIYFCYWLFKIEELRQNRCEDKEKELNVLKEYLNTKKNVNGKERSQGEMLKEYFLSLKVEVSEKNHENLNSIDSFIKKLEESIKKAKE